jgi:1,4-alpha-glucan branching enzyme
MTSATAAEQTQQDTPRATAIKRQDGTGVCLTDPWLSPFVDALKYRYSYYQHWMEKIQQSAGGLDQFSRGWEYFGFNYSPADRGLYYREWAPNARQAFLIGDFNQWNRTAHPMKRNEYGVWELFLPDAVNGECAIPHGSKVKVLLVTEQGERLERVPAWIRRVEQNLAISPVYEAVFWRPPQPYQWKHERPQITKPLDIRIYEAHGMLPINSPRAFQAYA